MRAHVRPCVRYRKSVLILQVNPFIHIVTEKFQADIWTMNMFLSQGQKTYSNNDPVIMDG